MTAIGPGEGAGATWTGADLTGSRARECSTLTAADVRTIMASTQTSATIHFAGTRTYVRVGVCALKSSSSVFKRKPMSLQGAPASPVATVRQLSLINCAPTT
jgi:hypothetical protein